MNEISKTINKMKRNLVFVFLFVSVNCYSQSHISINLIDRNDADKQFINKLNFSFGNYFYEDLIIGITNEKVFADYIQDGYTPVRDSLTIANYQIFSRFLFENNLFLSVKSPISSFHKKISIQDVVRIGFGYNFDLQENTNFYVSYSMLLNPNDNGFKKGKFNLGISLINPNHTKKRTEKILSSFIQSKLFNSIHNWLNKPVEYGYREFTMGR